MSGPTTDSGRSFSAATLGGLLAAVSVLGAGCVTGGAVGSYPSEVSVSPAHAEIENNNWADVAVFVVRYGDWRRLGTVMSMTTVRFRLPQAWVDRAEPVAIRVEPVGKSGVFVTRDVPLEGGAVFRVSVKNWLSHSTLVIR